MRARLRERLDITPERYALVALVALVALTVIVVTGAAVRLTGSGLGCPDWPRCYGKTLPPLDSYALIEFGNRVLSGLVAVVAVAAGVLVRYRRPFRRDLAWIAALLPLGVIAQAVLGGITVQQRLAPGYVMAHFGLSMLVLIAAVALAWRARVGVGTAGTTRGEAAAAAAVACEPRTTVLAVRAVLGLTAIAIFVGTAATAAGPHAGGKPHEAIQRLTFMGSGTLDWTIHRHGELAAALGLAAVGLWLWLRRSGAGAGAGLRRAVTWLCVALGVQGAVGLIQYETHLPAAVVWLHVTLATLTWLCALWAVAAAGRLAPRATAGGAEAAVGAAAGGAAGEAVSEPLVAPRASAPV